MDNEGMNRRLCDVVIVLMIAWFALLTFAMVVYPGGYDFFGQPISVLGQMMVDGQPNTVSLTFYTLASCCTIPAYAMLAIIVPRSLSSNPVGKRLAIIGAVPGVVGLVFIVGTLLSPMDTAFEMHMLNAPMAFLCVLIAAAFFCAATWKAKEYPRLVPASWLLIIALTFVYGIFVFTTNDSSLFSTVLTNTLQKVIEYVLVMSIFLMVWLAKKRFGLDASEARKM